MEEFIIHYLSHIIQTMILRAENLIKKYGQRTVVNNVSFHVSRGEIVGLLGPNGAGKTTSFYMIVGLIKPNEGHVYLDDEDITTAPMYRRAQKELVIWLKKPQFSGSYQSKTILKQYWK